MIRNNIRTQLLFIDLWMTENQNGKTGRKQFIEDDIVLLFQNGDLTSLRLQRMNTEFNKFWIVNV